MPNYLVFQLYGPLAGWGDIAVGERRSNAGRPSKSAVMGLIAAALGLRREQEQDLADLHDGYDCAIRLDLAGTPLRDFQTAQAPSARRNAFWPTRRDELAEADQNTVISWRDYQTGAGALVALAARDGAPYGLDDLAQALRQPVFTLYLGRKSCPLAAPTAPEVAETEDLLSAFAAYDKAAFGASATPRLFWDAAMPGTENLRPERVTRRRDSLLSRRAWLFAERVENEAVLKVETAQ